MKQSLYTFRILYDVESAEYVGRCTEFPNLIAFHPSYYCALEKIIELVDVVVRDMTRKGEEVPRPISHRLTKRRKNT